MPLFSTFIIFNIYSYNTNILSSILHHSLKPVFLYHHRYLAQQEEPKWDAELRFEIEPALQLADALQYTNWSKPHHIELLRTLLFLSCILFIYAAPYPELRRTLELCSYVYHACSIVEAVTPDSILTIVLWEKFFFHMLWFKRITKEDEKIQRKLFKSSKYSGQGKKVLSSSSL